MESTKSELLRNLRNRDNEEAWGEFYLVYKPFLMNIARKLGLSDQEADEVVADVLATCVEKLPTFELDRQKGFFRGWLKTVLQNKARDLWRRKPRAGIDLEEAQEPAIHDHVWSDWERSHQQRVLQFAIAAVRKQAVPNTWSCFEEHVLKSRPAAEVAVELKTTETAVYANCSRVVQRIRDKCAAYDESLAHSP